MTTFNAATTAQIDSAYASAVNGDTINLTGTNYAVDGEYTTPTGTKAVTFLGAGPTTRFGFLIIHASNSTWRNIRCQTMTGDPYYNLPGSPVTGVTVRDCQITQDYRTSTNASNWLIPEPYIACLSLESKDTGWSFYDCYIGDSINAKGCQLVANNTLFDHCTFQNIFLDNQGRNVGSGEEVHLEGTQAVGVSNCTWRRCTFIRNNVMAIMFTNYGGNPATSGITLENNLFAHTVDATNLTNAVNNDPWHASSALYIHYLAPSSSLGSLTNWTVRYNTFETSVTCDSRPVTNSKWVGNVGAWPNLAGMTYKFNVGTKIHATDTAVSPAASAKGSPAPFGWVDSTSPAYNFHLGSGSVCRGKGDPTDFPSTDRDGVSRT